MTRSLVGRELYTDLSQGYSDLPSLAASLRLGDQRTITPEEIVDPKAHDPNRLAIAEICRLNEVIYFCREDLYSRELGVIFGIAHPDQSNGDIRKIIHVWLIHQIYRLLEV